ncbi:uncharacterized protein LOC136061679 [Quercus suber]|uniref:uncharacterized protein LOC136061679 n=1 Tax=Quercus suber TaxID=58331 RepID=UPI0032DFE7F5
MMNKFIVDYGIPNNVNLKYCEEGEWYLKRREGEVVIPIVAFVEGGMRIPMRPVTLNYLRHFRLSPTQYPHAFARHFHLVNKADLETVLRSELFLNESDNQVRAAHKILGCDPAQTSFPVPQHVIRARDPRLTRITVVESGFSFTGESYIPEGIPLSGPSSSQQVTVAEKGPPKKAREVVELSSSEDEYSVFDLADQPEDPPGDLGDPHLSEADLQSLRVGTQAEMGLKRQSTNLLDLLEGGSKKDVPGELQSQPPAPQSQVPIMQTSSSSTPIIAAPSTESPDPKRKRLSKGKDPMDGSKSHSSPEEGKTRRPPKQLKLGDQKKGKKVIQQLQAQAWLPAAMLHDQPLMDNASIRESQGDEGALVAEALEKSLLLPIDMAELEKMSGVEVVFDLKKYLGMAIQALFRLGEEVDDHSHALAQERDKFLEAAKTLKRSEADLKKATEDLAEMAKARDTAVSDLAVVRKQAEDQTVHLQEVESQLQKAKEDISYMKGSLTKAIHDKGVASMPGTRL